MLWVAASLRGADMAPPMTRCTVGRRRAHAHAPHCTLRSHAATRAHSRAVRGVRVRCVCGGVGLRRGGGRATRRRPALNCSAARRGAHCCARGGVMRERASQGEGASSWCGHGGARGVRRWVVVRWLGWRRRAAGAGRMQAQEASKRATLLSPHTRAHPAARVCVCAWRMQLLCALCEFVPRGAMSLLRAARCVSQALARPLHAVQCNRPVLPVAANPHARTCITGEYTSLRARTEGRRVC